MNSYNPTTRFKAYLMSIGIAVLAFSSCKKEDPVDPNLDKYVVQQLKVFTTKADDLNAIVSITKATETDYNIDAIVPDDANPGKRFRIEFTYPEGITPLAVSPVITDSIDFSVPKTFTIQFSAEETRKFTVNIAEQAPQAPQITEFSIAGAEQTAIDNDNLRINIRVAAGTNVSAVTPKITVTPSTALVVGGQQALNFSTVQYITVKNGGISKRYAVLVSDYGFTRVKTILDKTAANGARPSIFTGSSETSIAFDEKGQNTFVSFAGGIKKYNLSTPQADPTDLRMILPSGMIAPVKVLQSVGNTLFSCNNPWAGGDLVICAWTKTGPLDSPVEVLRIPVPSGAIFQNFQLAQQGVDIIAYFVNRAPLRSSPKADPVAYTARITPAAISGTAKVTSFETSAPISGLVSAGAGDGPNIELIPIPNSTDFIFNSGTLPPCHVNSNFSNPIWFSSALVNGSSVGAKAFEFNRGKYLMYGVFSWSTNLANPKASKFMLLDATRKGYRQSIADVNGEF
ncbi:MAG: hypothetical protein LW630_11920, partial [Saprospiraceae bacterium]|nr:hypothetical protein [Saprospiraceae bacterium]